MGRSRQVEEDLCAVHARATCAITAQLDHRRQDGAFKAVEQASRQGGTQGLQQAARHPEEQVDAGEEQSEARRGQSAEGRRRQELAGLE